jgi:hypothetical protein
LSVLVYKTAQSPSVKSAAGAILEPRTSSVAVGLLAKPLWKVVPASSPDGLMPRANTIDAWGAEGVSAPKSVSESPG